MIKKIELSTLDIPLNDVECWNKYTNHKWVYDLSQLLDSQHISWSLFKDSGFSDRVVNIQFDTTANFEPSYIYYNKPEGNTITSEVFIVKGEIRHLHHIDKTSMSASSEIIGNIQLRISAFVSIYFHKFTGIVSVDTINNEIYAIHLRSMYPELFNTYNTDIAKLIKRIYKKNISIQLNGLTDQALHESLVS